MLDPLREGGVFGRVHHRTLNSIDALRGVVPFVGRDPRYLELAEGDVCWLDDGDTMHLFMMHPSSINTLPPRETLLRDLEAGTVPRIEDVLADEFASVPLVVELKTGHGSARRAMERLTALLQERAAGRHYIDAFSPGLLELVKEASPETPTSLHTRLGVYGPLFVKTAFELPPIGVRRVRNLPFADILTVTYAYSPARFLRAFGDIDAFHRHVHQAGKLLFFGGVRTPEIFELVERSRAHGAYLKFPLRQDSGSDD